MSIVRGFKQRNRKQACGNARLLVVVNSAGAYWDYSIVDETVIVALEHFGMPYSILDLASARLTLEVLDDCACIVLAQCHLGNALTSEETGLISEAVHNGTGLVNFDNDVGLYGNEYLEIFGFDNINPHPFATNIMCIGDNSHYITEMQNHGELHKFDRMVTAVMIGKYRKDVIPLAEGILGKDQLIYIRHLTPWSAYEPGNHPCLFATRWGRGKAVQFTINPRVWRNGFFGHAKGIDDLFSRSIIWAVRKPFAANMIPPFVTMSFDDCSGRYGFAYVDSAVRHGYIPLPSLFLNNISEDMFPKIREGLESGKVEYNTHAFDYYNLLTRHYGKGDCTPDELKRNFAIEDEWWKRVGATQCKTLRFHFLEYSVNALPFLKERGRTLICPGGQTGLIKADNLPSDGYWPYKLQNFHHDYLPDDNDFYSFTSLLKRFSEDFLIGCTQLSGENEINDIEKAAKSAAYQVQLGLRSGFFSEIITHEQRFGVLSLEEWERILVRTDELTGNYEKIYAGHDYIGEYLRSREEMRLEECTAEGGHLRLRFSGKSDMQLKISLFKDVGDSIDKEYLTLDAFEGSAQI